MRTKEVSSETSFLYNDYLTKNGYNKTAIKKGDNIMSNNKQIRFSFRKGLKKDLPSHAPLGEPLFCTDTGELYVGMGNYQEIKKITDPDLVCKCENTGGGSSGGYTNIPPEVVENTDRKSVV